MTYWSTRLIATSYIEQTYYINTMKIKITKNMRNADKAFFTQVHTNE